MFSTMRVSAGLVALLAVLASPALPSRAGDVIHIVSPGGVSRTPVTDDKMWARIRGAARKYEQYAPVPRVGFFDITYPATPAEYRDLAGFGLLLVTIVTQDPAEVPLERVYFQAGDGLRDFQLLSSIHSRVEEPSVVEVLGPHRFDALFLFPMHLRRKPGSLVIDFAANRLGFALGKFPLLPEVDGLPTSPPDAETPPAAPLIRILERELPMFVGLETLE